MVEIKKLKVCDMFRHYQYFVLSFFPILFRENLLSLVLYRVKHNLTMISSLKNVGNWN